MTESSGEQTNIIITPEMRAKILQVVEQAERGPLPLGGETGLEVVRHGTRVLVRKVRK